MSAWEYQTSWRILETPKRKGLDIRIVIDTRAPAIVELIEDAAERAGILLEREERDDDA
jgi:hypothetical protein